MGFNETVEALRQMISSGEAQKHFPKGYVDYARRTVEAMAGDIEVAQASLEDRLQINPKVVSDVKAVLRDSVNTIVLENTNQFRARFIQNYVLLAVNWNRNLAQDEEIYRIVQTIDRVKEMHRETLGLIEVTRQLVGRVKSMLDREPPVYNVSRHYLQSIKERLN